MSRAIRNQKSEISSLSTYWERTHWPLQSLYFLLPLIVVYEFGVAWYASDLDISARTLLRFGFSYFGVTGYFLPGLIALAYLVVTHLMRRDPWEPEPGLWMGMWAESILLAVPLVVMVLVFSRQASEPLDVAVLAGSGIDHIPNWRAGMVLSIGAGIYEELLFRVIAIALVHMVLVDFLQVPDHWGALTAIAFSAIAFSLYHFIDPNAGNWPQMWSSFKASFHFGQFAFYAAAGLYLVGIYMLRGFGIVAATHALYDVFVITVMFMQHER